MWVAPCHYGSKAILIVLLLHVVHDRFIAYILSKRRQPYCVCEEYSFTSKSLSALGGDLCGSTARQQRVASGDQSAVVRLRRPAANLPIRRFSEKSAVPQVLRDRPAHDVPAAARPTILATHGIRRQRPKSMSVMILIIVLVARRTALRSSAEI